LDLYKSKIMRSAVITGILLNVFLVVSYAQSDIPPESELYPRPAIIPKTVETKGVQKSVISLAGTWKLNPELPEEFWRNSVDFSSWSDVLVPSHISTQGFSVREVQQYAYKLKLQVPPDFAGKRIFIKFHGVTGMAKAWINGTFLKEHFGGFTTWDCDITDYVTPGREAVLTVAIDDKRRGLSGYNNGGILRDVELIAVPHDYITRLNIETDLDENYKDAVLKIRIAMSFNQGNTSQINFTLLDAAGKAVSLAPYRLTLTKENPEKIIEIPVASPLKWDAEHPNLYKLEASVVQDDKTTHSVSKNVGFREVKRAGKKLLVNGREVKLRGVNRKDIYPLTGRSVPLEFREMDARIFSECNMNYVRTSHYPAHEEFLDACDKYGIYVESENSVSFANGQVPNNPELTVLYLSQLAEMVERDRSHPSIIIWSVGNESAWGENVAKSSEYVKHEDPSRPVKFSWSHLIPPEVQPRYIDIFSFHYPYWERDMDAGGPLPEKSQEISRQSGTRETDPTEFPVLHDEYAHTPIYITQELRRDPDINNFWGETIKRIWENIFTTEGALGGAIWCAVDNSSIVPEDRLRVSGFDWGLVDGWRRKKPEYWHTQKAYSPVRIENRVYSNPGADKPLKVPVKNWFDHTNLNEIKITWSVGAESGQITGPDVEPHTEGSFHIPARKWKDGDVVNVKVFRAGDVPVDEFNLPVNPADRPKLPGPQGAAPQIITSNDNITVKGNNFELVFSRHTGLLTSGIYKGVKIIESGPYLNLIGQKPGGWTLKSIDAKAEGQEAVLNITGSYEIADVGFEVKIDGHGLITTQYTLLSELPPLTRKLVADGYNRDVGGYWELGVSYVVSSEVDRLRWEREGLWSAYPVDHIGRNEGIAYREGKGHNQQYGEIPTWPWSEDEKDFTLFGRNDPAERGTRDFRGTKENIYNATALLEGSEKGIQALSNGTDYVRLEVIPAEENIIDDTDSRISYSGEWTNSENQKRSNTSGNTIEFTFKGTGIIWSGSRDQNGGTVDIYIDNKLESGNVSLLAIRGRPGPGAPVSNTSAEPLPQPPVELFTKTGLSKGQHTIKIVVSNNGDNSTGIVSSDSFRILGSGVKGDVRFIVNNEWNIPNLAWGDYVKDPVLPEKGYTNKIYLKFSDN
jgi:hypothetical protein